MAFVDPMSEVYLSCFNAALPLFTHFNALLQRSDPQALNVYPMTKELAGKLVTRSIKAELLDNVSLDTLENEDNFLLCRKRIQDCQL